MGSLFVLFLNPVTTLENVLIGEKVHRDNKLKEIFYHTYTKRIPHIQKEDATQAWSVDSEDCFHLRDKITIHNALHWLICYLYSSINYICSHLLVDEKLNLNWQCVLTTQKPTISWAALEEAWPAGWEVTLPLCSHETLIRVLCSALEPQLVLQELSN